MRAWKNAGLAAVACALIASSIVAAPSAVADDATPTSTPSAVTSSAPASTASASASATSAAPTTVQSTTATIPTQAVPSTAASTVAVAPTSVPTTSATSTSPSTTASTATAPADATPPASVSTSTRKIAASAVGDPPTLSLNVSVESDGTPIFDADDAAGHDSSATNGIVRVNDTVTYAISYAVNGALGKNVTLAIAFPKGMEIKGVPGYCKTGSTLLPASIGSPTLPLTVSSNTQLAEQTLTCLLGDKSYASEVLRLSVTAHNLVPNGYVYTVKSASLTAGYTDASGAAATAQTSDATPPSVTASSKLSWDISKNGMNTLADSSVLWGPAQIACPWDGGVYCYRTVYQVMLSAPASGKGAMPAIGDIAFDDDLTPAAMYPSLTLLQQAAITADTTKYGSRLSATMRPAYIYSGPGGTANQFAGGTVTNVRNSGTPIVTTPAYGVSAPATDVTVTLHGTDSSLLTYPTLAADDLTAIPAGSAYIVSGTVYVYTPTAVVADFGVSKNGVSTLNTRNQYTNLSIHGFGTAVETTADQPTWNDYRTTAPNISKTASYDATFFGEPKAAGNMTPTAFTPGWAIWEGPAGTAQRRSGQIVVSPSQTVMAGMVIGGLQRASAGAMSVLGCQSWNSSQLQLQARNYPGSSVATAQRIPSGGAAVWMSGFQNAVIATTAAQVPSYSVQYAATRGATGNASTCGDNEGPWYDTPDAVPGNDATLAAQGIYTAVQRVRVWVDLPAISPANSDVRPFAHISIGLRVVDNGTLATGDILGTWSACLIDVNASESRAAMLTDATLAFTKSTYNPTNHSGGLGDRLIVSVAQTRLLTQIRKGTTGTYSQGTPQVTGGDTLQFQLSPTLTNGAVVPGILRDVWIEDCLPAGLTYARSMVTPSIVSVGSTPSDARVPACATGETYIRWVVPNQEVNVAVAPLTFDVTVKGSADDAVYSNSAQVWAQGDVSAATLRQSGATFQVAQVAGVQLETAAQTPITQTNRPEQTLEQENVWTVSLSNTLPVTAGVTLRNADIIDVLPVQGASGTSFHGTLAFTLASVLAGGSTVRLLYTSSATIDPDPLAASNAAGGTTAWCDAPSLGALVSGTGGCPVDAAHVTGVRVLRAGAFQFGETISVEIRVAALNNRSGDVYADESYAYADGLRFGAGPYLQEERVVESSLGDHVWVDLNRDGIQQPAEPTAGGIPVTLTGTDDLGNAVSLSTTTDAGGTYGFAHLRSSGNGPYVVTFGLPAGYSGFTAKTAAGQELVDSNADATGAASVQLAPNTADTTIDAGLLAVGSLHLVAHLTGAGVSAFAYGSIDFQATCTFGGATVLDRAVTVALDGTSSVSAQLAGIPVGAACQVSQTTYGAADPVTVPVTLSTTIPWSDAVAARTVTLTAENSYSRGTLTVRKVVNAPDRLALVRTQSFRFVVTCERQVTPESWQRVFSGEVLVQGGSTTTLLDGSGSPLALPLGTECYAQETGSDAAATVIDHDTRDSAAIVASGTPDVAQQLVITATNTFVCTDVTCPVTTVPTTVIQAPAAAALASTGGPALSYLLLDLLMFAAGTVILGRRRGARRSRPMPR